MSSNHPKTSTEKVNIAVVGLGFMGVTHLRAYLQVEAAKIVAVCDAVRLPVNGVLEGVAGNIKKSDDINLGTEVKVFRKLEEVLADPEVTLVDLCTPTPLHPQQAIAALRAGKNVLCEKPIARTSASAQDIVQAEAAAAGFLMPAMCMRFWPGWSWLKQAVDDKRYGKVLSARFRRISEMPGWSKQGTYSSGSDLGGALFDLHIHDTDFVQFLFGPPQSVFSTGVMNDTGSINHVMTQYVYPGGPCVSAEGGWLLPKGFNMGYTIHCEHATFDFDLARGANAMQVIEEAKPPYFLTYENEPDGYGGEVRYVVECAQAGRRPSTVTARDGFTALKICEAEETSLKTGKVVEL
jgi:predicted dehydrogenase